MAPHRIPVEERFWRHVVKTETCWLYNGFIDPPDYQLIGLGGAGARNVTAHRFSWELHNGPIPDGLGVLHSCDVKNCIRPTHLFLGTTSDNMIDMYRKGLGPVAMPRPDMTGSANPASVLTEAKVLDVRLRASKERRADQYWGDYLGVSAVTARNILLGITWKHVGGPIETRESQRVVTIELAEKIRLRRAQKRTYAQLSEEFNVSIGTARDICLGLRWT